MNFVQHILWQDTLWKEESGWQNIRDIWDGKRKQGGWRLSNCNGEMSNQKGKSAGAREKRLDPVPVEKKFGMWRNLSTWQIGMGRSSPYDRLSSGKLST